MQLQASGPESHNMNETKFSNCMWINKWLDRHQNHEKCGIVKENNVQTPKEKIMFIQSHYVMHVVIWIV
jgi:hypothetical protein